jgi:hypothetical protein
LRGMKAARELAKIGLNRSETVRGPSRTVRETVREISGGYRHKRPASDQAAAFTRAFEPSLSGPGSATTTGTLESASIGRRLCGEGASPCGRKLNSVIAQQRAEVILIPLRVGAGGGSVRCARND